MSALCLFTGLGLQQALRGWLVVAFICCKRYCGIVHPAASDLPACRAAGKSWAEDVASQGLVACSWLKQTGCLDSNKWPRIMLCAACSLTLGALLQAVGALTREPEEPRKMIWDACIWEMDARAKVDSGMSISCDLFFCITSIISPAGNPCAWRTSD